MTTLLSCKTSENAVEMVILEYSALQIGIINMGMLLVKNLLRKCREYSYFKRAKRRNNYEYRPVSQLPQIGK